MKKLLLLPFILSSFSLFAQEGKPAKGGNYMQTLIMLAVALVFFYFILLRPEQKRRKYTKICKTMTLKNLHGTGRAFS